MAQASEPRFDESVLLAEATRRAEGLDDFGDDAFREPLRILCRDLEQAARLSADGREMMWERMVTLLLNRLRMEDWIRRYPEILDERIRAPLVVVGLPRTGTTTLHRLLSSDPDANAVIWWENRNPAPFPGGVWGDADPRIASAKDEVRAMLQAQPELVSIHPYDAMAPDEECLLREHSFSGTVVEAFAYLPNFGQWMETHDQTPAYRFILRMLQFLQWQKRQAGNARQHWVLKTPEHLATLDILFKLFPDATVIQTHRDPLVTIPSITSFNYSLWLLYCADPDPAQVGRIWSAKFAHAIDWALDVRDTMPPERFVDLDYREVASRPLAAVEKIYAALGKELRPEARARMEKWARDNQRDQRPAHDYSLEKFGFTEQGIAKQFARYRERFILNTDWAR